MIHTASDTGIDGHITALGHETRRYTIFYVGVLVPPVTITGWTFAWIADAGRNTVGLRKSQPAPQAG